MSMMGCLGVWVTDEITPTGDYVSFSCVADRTIAINVVNTIPFYVDWDDGIIKLYSDITDTAKFVGAGNVVKLYDGASITDFNIEQIDTISGLDNITDLRSMDLGINAETIDFIPAAWNLETLILKIPNATSVTTDASWPLVFLFIGNASALTTINTSATWVNLDWVEIDGGDGGVLSSFIAHPEWTAMLYFHITDMALTETVVNNILIALDASGMSGGEIDLSGGTSATPSGAGAAAASNLTGRGNAVITN